MGHIWDVTHAAPFISTFTLHSKVAFYTCLFAIYLNKVTPSEPEEAELGTVSKS